jgi:hypothetical protein
LSSSTTAAHLTRIRAWRVLGAAIAIAAGAAPVARADAPRSLAVGSRPDVAVDGVGTAFVAYLGNEPLHRSTHLCRLPRGATTCVSAVTLPSPGGDAVDRPHVFFAPPSTVRVLAYRYGTPTDRDFLWTSTDGGRSFGPPIAVGTLPLSGDAAAGPGAGISIVTHAVALTSYQRVKTVGLTSASAGLSSLYPFQGAVALTGDGRPVVTFSSISGASVAFSAYDGSGDVNNATNWTPAREVDSEAAVPRLAGGAKGLFLMLYEREQSLLSIRQFDGTSFTAPHTVRGSGEADGSSAALAQDGSGELHAVWQQAGERLEHAASVDGGLHWTGNQLTTDPDSFSDLRVAVAFDHQGLAVWQAGTGAAAEVHFTPLHTFSVVLPTVAVARSPAVFTSGRILIRLTCASPAFCSGELRLSTRAPLAGASSATRRRPRMITLGRARFSIRAHHVGRLRVRVTRAGRRLLRHHRVRRITVTVVSRRPDGHARTFRRSVPLHQRR